jgi:hypothetical protein
MSSAWGRSIARYPVAKRSQRRPCGRATAGLPLGEHLDKYNVCGLLDTICAARSSSGQDSDGQSRKRSSADRRSRSVPWPSGASSLTASALARLGARSRWKRRQQTERSLAVGAVQSCRPPGYSVLGTPPASTPRLNSQRSGPTECPLAMGALASRFARLLESARAPTAILITCSVGREVDRLTIVRRAIQQAQ